MNNLIETGGYLESWLADEIPSNLLLTPLPDSIADQVVERLKQEADRRKVRVTRRRVDRLIADAALMAAVAGLDDHFARSALVPTVVNNDAELVEANSRLSLLGGICGFAAAAAGAALAALMAVRASATAARRAMAAFIARNIA